ncbi:glycosyltransferase [Erythrobacter arachoides]|uniref:Glycosyltransferase n=1 Tax=Aurantiacibacter arachoides TaxID=1850444 RepID=A0A845A0B4_9SPHN|nr:glycosyltransferase family 4 protein [Aurantiacibacter arachoides]MXO93398.1 glycosyltransferase [Aurantiacibacter arachoides]GGD49668.1 glycosyltransferase WbuB [Aurantiacibacter arachoides]
MPVAPSSDQPSLIFVNRYFWPDRSATSQILSDVAFHLAESGLRVKIVASRLSYEGDEGPYKAREVHRGVEIHRVATPGFGRGTVVGRVVDYLGFYVTSFLAVARLARRGDVVVAKTDPPVLSWPIGIAAGLSGARRANWLQDLYPEVAVAFGMVREDGLVTRMVRRLRNASLIRADCNIAIGNRMADLLRREGVPDNRIAVIPNMTDDAAIVPVAAADNPLRVEWGYREDQLVVGYSGNLGRAHEIDTMLGAAEQLQQEGRRDIRFLFVGGGFLREALDQQIVARSLTNIDLRPYQPREHLHLSLTVPDVHWVSLLPALEGLIVPSKFYGAAASGRPVIFIGSAAGELGDVIPESDGGAIVAVGDSAVLAATLRDYADDPARRSAHGRNARALVENRFTRAQVLQKWECLARRLLAADT